MYSSLNIELNKLKEMTVEEFFKNDRLKIDVFKSKYARDPSENVYNCFNRIASQVGSVSIEDSGTDWVDRWTCEMMLDIWRPGGSIISGINKYDKKISLFNCAHIPIMGDSIEDIADARYKCQKAAAYRQGIGIDFSPLRPRGSSVENSAEKSDGAIHWMKSFDHIGYEVGQHGRKPALLFSLKVNHPDVEELISVKDDMKTLQNANISIQITDDFMKAVGDDEDWEMKFDMNGKNQVIKKNINARELFRKITDHAWLTGDPGVQFIDLMKEYSIQEALGYEIMGTNACSEKPLPPDSVCCLASLNMEKVPHIYSNNYDTAGIISNEFHVFMENVTTSIVRFMDNVIQYELDHPYKSPYQKQYNMVEQLREIGMGVTNIHKWLFDQGLAYDGAEGIDAIEQFFMWYSYYSFKASCLLAKERGSCPAINDDSKKHAFKETKFLEHIFTNFPELKSLYYAHGIRNAALLSVAPTGCGLITNEIITTDGIKTIKQILDENNINHNIIHESNIKNIWFNLSNKVTVVLRGGVTQDINKIYYNGKAETKTITFEDGKSYTFTLNHPLLVNRDGTEIWIIVDDLEVGDDIVDF